MKKFKLILAGFLIISQPLSTAYAQTGGTPPLSTAQQRLGYALGMGLGKSLMKMHPDIELKALLDGIRDTYSGQTLLLSAAEAKRIKSDFRKQRIRQNKIIQADKQIFDNEAQKTIQEKAEEKPAYNLDFSMVDQSTPQNTAWSFVILYNDLMPVFSEKHIDRICQLLATSEFMKECHAILKDRLDFLQKDPVAIERAIFTNPKVSVNNDKQNSYYLTWIETFTSPEGRKTVNHPKISIQLAKRDKWEIESAHFMK